MEHIPISSCHPIPLHPILPVHPSGCFCCFSKFLKQSNQYIPMLGYSLGRPPSQDASQHKDYNIFSRDQKQKPSFASGILGKATMRGREVFPLLCTIHPNGRLPLAKYSLLKNLIPPITQPAENSTQPRDQWNKQLSIPKNPNTSRAKLDWGFQSHPQNRNIGNILFLGDTWILRVYKHYNFLLLSI